MKARLLSQGQLSKYVRATYGRAPMNGESLLDLVADELVRRNGLERGLTNARKFVEKHRDLVVSAGHETPKGGGTVPAQPRHQSAPAASSDEFLASFEWRRVRMVALKRYGAKCQCCGASPADGAVMNVDHIKPRRIFPSLALDVDNLQVLCAPCNHGKGNWDMTDWRKEASVP